MPPIIQCEFRNSDFGIFNPKFAMDTQRRSSQRNASFPPHIKYPCQARGRLRQAYLSPEHHAVPRTVMVQGGAGQARNDKKEKANVVRIKSQRRERRSAFSTNQGFDFFLAGARVLNTGFCPVEISIQRNPKSSTETEASSPTTTVDSFSSTIAGPLNFTFGKSLYRS